MNISESLMHVALLDKNYGAIRSVVGYFIHKHEVESKTWGPWDENFDILMSHLIADPQTGSTVIALLRQEFDSLGSGKSGFVSETTGGLVGVDVTSDIKYVFENIVGNRKYRVPSEDFIKDLKDYWYKERKLEKEESEEKVVERYTSYDFDNDVKGIEYEQMASKLKYKPGIILKGAIGVGKTYIARRFCYAYMGCKDDDRIMDASFGAAGASLEFFGHNNTRENKFVEGRFIKFCKEAEKNSDKTYFVFLDELGRFDTSEIWGRINKCLVDRNLNYEIYGNKYKIPKNVYFIMTMNEVDKSIVRVDIAVEDRFSVIEVKPEWDSEYLKMKIQGGISSEWFYIDEYNKLKEVSKCMNRLNSLMSQGNSSERFLIGTRNIHKTMYSKEEFENSLQELLHTVESVVEKFEGEEFEKILDELKDLILERKVRK